MRQLLIGEAERKKIHDLKALAANNPLSVVNIAVVAAKNLDVFRNMMATMSIMLPNGFAVVYTHEIQPDAPPPGLCHHISISVDTPHEVPSIEAVAMILEAFGMKGLAMSNGVWVEDVSPTFKAINILQLMEVRAAGGEAVPNE